MVATSDYLKLHFIVFLWGFTGILGKLISIPAVEMVFYRTLLAAFGMGVLILLVRGTFKVSKADFIKILLTGFIVGIHWLAFFLSARISNVSVSLVGFATGSLWTAFLEPLVKKQKIRYIEVVFGLMVLTGLYIIFASDFGYSGGLMLAIFSGLTCAIFSIINSQLVQRVHAFTITFYEMTGACLIIVLFFPFYLDGWAAANSLQLSPTLTDWIYIMLLAWLCSVYGYSAAVQLTKRITVFLFQLTMNLEPVYGIVMAVVVFGETEKMNSNFYIGTLFILMSVLLYPMMKRRFTAAPTSKAGR